MRHRVRFRLGDGINVLKGNYGGRLRGPQDSQQILSITMRCLAGMSLLTICALFVPRDQFFWITLKLLVQQDIWLLELFFLLSILIFVLPCQNVSIISFRFKHVVLISIAIIAFCYLGHRLVLMGYDLSRDEQMANFDASIFARGRLVWPLPQGWQSEASALNLEFMLPVSQPVAWVSAYLPMNAVLRAVVGTLGDSALTGPLLTAGSLLLMLSIAKCIWPTDTETPTITLLILLGSGQLVITGMTAYAMPAHLFFNLLWLRLFMADRPACDGAAVFTGFVATGLHQPLFHPMFIAPFLFLLFIEKRWARLLSFMIGYGAVCLFWLLWPLLIHSLMTGPNSITAAGGTDYLSRLLQALSFNMGSLTLTAANLLRFCAWQHLFLLPLLATGFLAAKKDRFAGAVAVSFILPIIVMAVILPWQGIGFGYRYLHGVLGNAALLAGYGWRYLNPSHEQLRPLFLKATVASLVILLPVQGWMAHARYQPFASASQKIDKSGADYAIIEAKDGPLMMDSVINRADLSNRPIRLAYENIRNVDMLAQRICKPGVNVALATDAFYAPLWAYFNLKPEHRGSPSLTAAKNPFERAGCDVQLIS